MAPNIGLGIFDTFKTGTGLTGEAGRQRSIIAILAGKAGPSERTRTGIAKKMAEKHETPWKNIYSGIFRDIDEILLPMGIVEENGRLPLKRGPKALQEMGIPYYHLTRKGMLTALAIPETKNRDELLSAFFADAEPEEKEHGRVLTSLAETCPGFTYLVFEKYVQAFCEGQIDELVPFDPAKIGSIHDEFLRVQKEMLEGFLALSKQDRDKAVKFLKILT
ncbi:MAG: hypothetical protein D9C04_04490 [Nitrosopumilus sp. B06]|nr:MAG: hypothetical protein EB828_00490 [Nitrosopumilus sp. D6]RNJ79476.1 MAG: hypothetical protein D9C04_04490 [Nitrosopumilus sp. B06]